MRAAAPEQLMVRSGRDAATLVDTVYGVVQIASVSNTSLVWLLTKPVYVGVVDGRASP